MDTSLNEPLEGDALDDVKAKRLRIQVNRDGKVTCSDGEVAVGVGRSPLLAYKDWSEKFALRGKGTE